MSEHEFMVTNAFALPREDGRWDIRHANVHFVEGLFHKIDLPGLETRSSGELGITATFHFFFLTGSRDGNPIGNIMRMTVQNGQVVSTDLVEEDAEVANIEYGSAATLPHGVQNNTLA